MNHDDIIYMKKIRKTVPTNYGTAQREALPRLSSPSLTKITPKSIKLRNAVKKRVIISDKNAENDPNELKNTEEVENSYRDQANFDQIEYSFASSDYENNTDGPHCQSLCEKSVIYKNSPSQLSHLLAIHKNFGMEKLSIISAAESKITESLHNSSNLV